MEWTFGAGDCGHSRAHSSDLVSQGLLKLWELLCDGHSVFPELPSHQHSRSLSQMVSCFVSALC